MNNTTTPDKLPTRKWLQHEQPSWVGNNPKYFITLCCASRGENTLCIEPAGQAILNAAKHYEEMQKWFVHTFLLMPDHLHAIVCLPSDCALSGQIAAFKKFTTHHTGIRWQRGFFDHRLRNDESLEDKIHYIAMNPVRKGLTQNSTDWPWVYKPHRG